MKNLIFLACALCAVQAVPVPAEQPNELEILQIPLQGNKVCTMLLSLFEQPVVPAINQSFGKLFI